jgi:hypothetical protein
VVLKTGALLAALALWPAAVAIADDLTGQASVIDGDTLETWIAHSALGR